MSRREGSITQRAKGSWQIQVLRSARRQREAEAPYRNRAWQQICR
jgi:hypothetical protein